MQNQSPRPRRTITTITSPSFEPLAIPGEFPPSQLAMRKRIQRGKGIPFINAIVAVMNCNSIMANTSVGGDDLDQVGKHLELRRATGNEVFVPKRRKW